jgi:GH15 family glucan-1,4-alpha-glucosidase
MSVKLEDYGFIGDTHTAALLGMNGSIDWMCLPRFDSAACFAALLGDEQNGCWRIAPAHPSLNVTRAYRKDTLILETEFETDHGAVRLIDCMPPRGSCPDLLRVVEGIRGEVPMEMKLVVRFDYGITVPWVQRKGGLSTMIAGPDALVLRTHVKTVGKGLSTVAEFSIAAGERKSFVLSWFPSHEKPPEAIDPEGALRETEAYWTDWVSRCTYKGEWRDLIVRSLITLKALTYAPTGGIVAAATTSLPEELGGVRNWDYRYCWLRDATFTLYSLMQSGFTEEASAWIEWLLRAIAGEPAQMQIMYGLAGERRLTEFELPHLPGYENSVPVRIGNAASEQFQLDVYGEILDAMHLARTVGIDSGATSWRLQRLLVKFVEKNWDKPDNGLWEIRGPRRHFTHSKVMAWVAIDRAVKAVEQFGLEGDLSHWKRLRQSIQDEVCLHGYNPSRKAFTQYYGSDNLDASLLMIPLVGFLPSSDERVRTTVELIQKELMVDGFVLRYHPDDSAHVDGLPPGEGSFLPCSFWLVDCLCLMERRKEARALFGRLLAVCNDLGLLSEEYDAKKKRQVGNLPQAFTHVGLINSARALSHDQGASHHRSRQ